MLAAIRGGLRGTPSPSCLASSMHVTMAGTSAWLFKQQKNKVRQTVSWRGSWAGRMVGGTSHSPMTVQRMLLTEIQHQNNLISPSSPPCLKLWRGWSCERHSLPRNSRSWLGGAKQQPPAPEQKTDSATTPHRRGTLSLIVPACCTPPRTRTRCRTGPASAPLAAGVPWSRGLSTASRGHSR